jgi:hypothetical protein
MQVTDGAGRHARRFRFAGRWLPAGAVLAGLVLLGASSPASAQALAWSLVPSPNRAVRYNYLEGVSCVSAAACTAVGYGGNDISGEGKTLAEAWNGTSWSVVPSLSLGNRLSVLEGVSCVSVTACMAVGHYTQPGATNTLVESWNGTSWSVLPSPNPSGNYNTLEGVSCVSATACMAVGARGDGAALIESWNGASWSVVPSPSPMGHQLMGVSCVSATACMAVGALSGGTLVESWNGTSWSVVPSPNQGTMGNTLEGVSCVSVTACTAVGRYGTRGVNRGANLIESWNGTSWSVAPSPSGGGISSTLEGVSCASATACTAVGSHYSPFTKSNRIQIESWNGTSWSVVHGPNRGSDPYLDSVSCASATACTAAGNYRNTTEHSKTLIEAGAVTG